MEKSYLSLQKITAYTSSCSVADYAWQIISSWDPFNKQTLGIQYQKSLDSMGGNIAEGFGRYFKKDKQRFFYTSRGSVLESFHWTERAKKRKLLTDEQYTLLITQLQLLPKEINWLIKITEEKLTR